MLRLAIVALASAALTMLPAPGSTAPTPIPGGANQVSGVSGKVGDTLFNGIVRLQVVELRDATAADHPETILPAADKKVMVMTTLVRNGLHSNFAELLTYALADKDDVAYEIASHWITPNPLNIPQGAAARQTALFPVDKNYAPVKLLVQCASCSPKPGFVAFRVVLPPPSASSPAP